ncbi:hypothetical protein BKA82DRAFT_2514837 [Pisolithus tinctorius]|nr:hypothetical protein BKA82DRAFT_2514837 [Pisolithus tinctorius]
MLLYLQITQTYVYYTHCSRDALTIKLVVAAVWILDTLHVSFMCHMLYYYLITNYCVLTSLEFIVWLFPASVPVNLLVITVVQLFFAHKIYSLCRPKLKWLVTVPVMLLILVHFGFEMAMIVSMLADNEVRIVMQIKSSVVIPFGAFNILTEGLIATSLSLLLYERSSHSSSPRKKRLLNTLIIYAVNWCLLTLLVTTAVLVTH